MMENRVIIIKNLAGEVFGIAESEAQAKKQIRWFLPKDNEYVVDILEVRGEYVFLIKSKVKL